MKRVTSEATASTVCSDDKPSQNLKHCFPAAHRAKIAPLSSLLERIAASAPVIERATLLKGAGRRRRSNRRQSRIHFHLASRPYVTQCKETDSALGSVHQ